jgi:prepilin-type N-terminal cleavage/methylation domain-containing protein
VERNKAIQWLLSAARDSRGLTLLELLAVILLFALLSGGVTSMIVMGQNIAQDTIDFSLREEQLANLTSLITSEGIDSSGIKVDEDRYIFEDNPKNVIVRYDPGNQNVTIFHGNTEMMVVGDISIFNLTLVQSSPVLYELILEGNSSGDEKTTLTHRWSPRR